MSIGPQRKRSQNPRSRGVLATRDEFSARWLKLGGVLMMVSGCMSYTTIEDEPPAQPRAHPEAWGYASTPNSCESSAVDDVCLRCEKKACCTEISACDQDCQAQYAQYQACLYPTPDVTWSGLGSAACRQRLTASGADTAKVDALIGCAATSCSTEDSCGVEPRAVFTYPPPTPANDFSAAEFVESYCAGCHFSGFVGPNGKSTSAFSTDAAWLAPRWNTSWSSFMDYDLIVQKKPAIDCGVSKDYFPTECLTLPSVDPGFFTAPAKFPPSGHGMYSGAPNPCRFAPDGMTCPQPTDFERARLVSWLADGTPR